MSRSYDQFKRVDAELDELLRHMESLEEEVERYKHSSKVYMKAYELVSKECTDISPEAVLGLEALGLQPIPEYVK
jgi:archaellum component FlaC